MRVAIAYLVVAGCGRIAFDSLGDSAGATGDAVDGASAPCANFDVVVDLPTGPSAAPADIVWTGSEYYVVMRTTVYGLQQLGADGTPGAHYDVLPSTENLSGMAWSGDSIGFVSYGGGAAHWRSFNPVDHSVGTPVTLNTTSQGNVVKIAWAGDRYIIGWQDANTANVMAREVSSSGALLTAELLLSTTGGPVSSVAATSTTYVFGVQVGTGAAVVTYQRQPMLIQTLAVDIGSSSGVAVVARSDGRFASTRTTVAGGSIRIQLHDTDGTPLGAGIANPLTSAATPFYQTIEPTSSGYRLSGIENISPHNLVHAELDGMGTVAAVQTTFGMINAPGFGAPSSFATTGRSLLVYPYDDGTGSNPTHMRAIQTCGN